MMVRSDEGEEKKQVGKEEERTSCCLYVYE
jgi:hypothetical protein